MSQQSGEVLFLVWNTLLPQHVLRQLVNFLLWLQFKRQQSTFYPDNSVRAGGWLFLMSRLISPPVFRWQRSVEYHHQDNTDQHRQCFISCPTKIHTLLNQCQLRSKLQATALHVIKPAEIPDKTDHGGLDWTELTAQCYWGLLSLISLSHCRN